jgi:hypothetical protein
MPLYSISTLLSNGRAQNTIRKYELTHGYRKETFFALGRQQSCQTKALKALFDHPSLPPDIIESVDNRPPITHMVGYNGVEAGRTFLGGYEMVGS